ncbi:hypothetical protein AAC387_Pa10g0435 [Persea americana]
MEDSIGARLSNTTVTKKKEKMTIRRTRLRTFLHLLLESLGPYIHTVKDVAADGNCGFRAIAGLLDMSNDSWMQVRIDLSNELQRYQNYYALVYGGEERVGELYYTLSYFESNPSFDRWMTMPDMGHLFFSYYKVVFMKPEAPMPPIATNWHRQHHPDADGWQLPYPKSIEQFKELIGNSVATQESVNLDSN